LSFGEDKILLKSLQLHKMVMITMIPPPVHTMMLPTLTKEKTLISRVLEVMRNLVCLLPIMSRKSRRELRIKKLKRMPRNLVFLLNQKLKLMPLLREKLKLPWEPPFHLIRTLNRKSQMPQLPHQKV